MVYPKPKLSKRHPEHRVYPYLLRSPQFLFTVVSLQTENNAVIPEW
ncbi:MULTISPECIES: hypothetical protein [[Limnothrix rosea] IAM M-220]